MKIVLGADQEPEAFSAREMQDQVDNVGQTQQSF
jgi:hypothetical protein